MKCVEIGTWTEETDKRLMIQLHPGYERALHKLDLFSHCTLFFLSEEGIKLDTMVIEHMHEQRGELLVKRQKSSSREISGQLLDIKPYFPNEEVIPDAAEPPHRFCINYRGTPIGRFLYHGTEPVLQLEAPVPEELQSGDYLRLLWYLHRFDKESFRKTRTCKPPYNNAPRTGIFASRSPVRPNPLASSIVKVQGVDHANGVIGIQGFDAFPGSEILQLMPYQPMVDRIDGAVLPPWVSHWTGYKSFTPPKALDLKPQDHQRTIPALEVQAETAFEKEYNSNEIYIHKAGIHNLKQVSLGIPKEKITLITGVSGSGKSSLAFDTLFAESRIQYMDLVMSNQMMSESFQSRQVESIRGLQPSIAISQRGLGSNPRSTVASVSRIGDLLRLVFSTIGQRICPTCHSVVDETQLCSTCGAILFDRSPQIFSNNHPDYMCPVCKGLGEEYQIDKDLIVEHPERSLLDSASSLYGDLRSHRKKPNANWMRGEVLALADDMKLDLELPFSELPEEFRQQFFYGSKGRKVSLHYQNANGRSGIITRPVEGAVNLIQRLLHDTKSSQGLSNGKRFMQRRLCSRCNGEGLLEEGRLVHILGHRYPELLRMSIDEVISWTHWIHHQLPASDREKVSGLLSKIVYKLQRIRDVGLSYISLDRNIPSLSGGEAQRLKLATQFGTGLTNILYIMDEPSRGLHPKDYRFLMDALLGLKKHGNTVVLVEHKKSFLSIADKHVLMGPKAGRYGGEIQAQYQGDELAREVASINDSDGFDEIQLCPLDAEPSDDEYIEIFGAATHNLQDIDIKLPKENMTAVIGVSGSGKSSLISKTLYPHLLETLGRSVEERGEVREITGVASFKDVHYVSQKAIGNNSRSTPGTYTGVFDVIRKHYAAIAESRTSHMGKEHFSFNSKKGQCPECKGLGERTVAMHYMDDIYIPCTSCQGKRYTPEVLEIKHKGFSIGDLLDMEIRDLTDLFADDAEISDRLSIIKQLGLGYLKLGQSACSLSGGEAQRIKLARELHRSECRNVLYILDEPTTGLHDKDVERLIKVFQHLRERGATLISITHNPRLIKACDYLVELGPGGGEQGGNCMRMGFLKR